MQESKVFHYAQVATDWFFSSVLRTSESRMARLRNSVAYEALSSSRTVMDSDQSSDWIRDALQTSEPLLVARFGSTELRAIRRWRGLRSRNFSERLYAAGARLEAPFWNKWTYKNLRVKSGFFPITNSSVENFYNEMLFSMSEISLLASWVPGENCFEDELRNSLVTSLDGISPFGTTRPWLSSLEGKRVLVVHPFEKSIQQQFVRKHLLFENPDFVPNFNLQTVKAVQSLGGRTNLFSTWFDALEFMDDTIKKKEFDVALIGAGAYGLPLGARIKQRGGKALVLGGILQLIFGIKGQRWDGDNLYNQYWERPLPEEKPSGYKGADAGAYW